MLLRADSSKSVNDVRFRNKTAVLFLCLAIVFLLIQFPGPASCSTTPATYYVLAGGAGNCSGFDWNNAGGKIPSNLNPGDVVYLGGSAGNLASTSNTPCPGERTHTFSSSGTASSHIQIVKCTSSISGCTSAAGWNAAYGTNIATWNENLTPDGTLKPPFWQFCGSYYDVNGSFGTSDQAGTYGILLQSNTRMFGFIAANENACGYSANITNLSYQYIEINGVNPNSVVSGNAGANGLYFGSPGSTSVSVQNISFTNMFIHDVFGPFSSAGNVIGMTFGKNWVYRNFCNSAQHSNGIDTQAPANNTSYPGIQNLTVYSTVWRNIQGTGVVTCLNGVCDGWKIYNNIVWDDSTWDTTAVYGDSTACASVSKVMGDNTPAGVVTNSVFYGNTIYNVHKSLASSVNNADESGVVMNLAASTGNSIENNLWFGNASSNVYTKYVAVAHDYNLMLNTATTGTTINSHEYHTTSGTANPFVSPSAGDFQVTAAGTNAPAGCSAGTNCYANGATLSSPYNVDFLGNARGAANGWTIGTFQYGSTTGSLPNPPSFLAATVQ